jgi:predicted regulator of Ras-like GTPase activity (Roadblock/LC7/MglB family)
MVRTIDVEPPPPALKESMLESILQGLREVEGVQGAMIVDSSAAVIAHRAHAIYDLAVLQQVARSVVISIDAVQLIQDDWDLMTGHFGDGKLLLRSLRVAGARPRRYLLAVIADTTLNVAFLSVALRVATAKLLAELAVVPAVPASQGSAPIGEARSRGVGTPTALPAGRGAEPPVGSIAITSSGVGSSGVGGSEVRVADSASSTYLSACTRALAASVGPMARVFVKEAVRKVCGVRPFSRADGPALLAYLEQTIEDAEDRATFQDATRTL